MKKRENLRYKVCDNKTMSYDLKLKIIAILTILATVISMATIMSGTYVYAANFENNARLYLDLTGFAGWEDASAEFKAFTFYGSDTNKNYQLNYNKESGYTQSELNLAIDLEPVAGKDGIYTFKIPDADLGAVQILRVSPDGSSAWNNSSKMFSNDMGSNNAIKINNWSNNSSWSYVEPIDETVSTPAFASNSKIYLDLTGFTSWTSDSATFKAFTFYSDNVNWNSQLNEEIENGYTAEQLAQAIDLVPVEGRANIFTFVIPQENLGAIQIVRTSADGSTPLNYSSKMLSNIKATNNAVKISGDNSSTWSYVNPSSGGGIGSDAKTAILSDAILNNPDLFTVDATFYDYYIDQEITNGWREMGSNSDYLYDWNGNPAWEPFNTFNSLLSTYASNNAVDYPLYFGNFYNKGDGHNGYTNFSNKVNNSSGLSNYNTSVAGIMHNTLVNNQLAFNDKDSSNAGASVPLFDSQWLTDNDAGETIVTQFPVRQETDAHGNTYYEFSSKNAQDNIWFDNYNALGAPLTMNYGSGDTYGVYDSLHWYSDQRGDNGYGFFPFDKRGEAGGTNSDLAEDFGFGMRLDIPFTVAKDGLLSGGVEQIFEFTGDDDLFVYVDGVLVLDLGGAHKEATGEVNFHTLSSSTSTGTENAPGFTEGSVNGSFAEVFGSTGDQKFDNQNENQIHTLTIFYMERGMIESNLSFKFNFNPMDDGFILEKEVNTADVNSGLINDLETTEEFNFTHSTSNTIGGTYLPSANVAYQYGHGTIREDRTTSATGQLTLHDDDTATYENVFTIGNYFKVNESFTSNIVYNTTWQAEDLVLREKGDPNYIIDTGSGTEAIFKYETLDNTTIEELRATSIKLEYTNTPVVKDLVVSKQVVDDFTNKNAVAGDNTNFKFIVLVDLNGGVNYIPYELDYVHTNIGGITSNATTSALGEFTLKHGEEAKIYGIPKGATYKVLEVDVPTSYLVEQAEFTGTIADANNVQFFNMQQSLDVQVDITKVLTGVSGMEKDQFTFELYKGVVGDPVNPKVTIDTVKSDENGNAQVMITGLNAVGTYTYYIEEIMPITPDNDVIYDNTIYTINVTVTADALGVLRTSVEFLKNGTDVVTDIIFTNNVKEGTVTVIKDDTAGSPLAGTTFGIYKVSANNEDISTLTPFETGITSIQPDGKSKIIFDNLPIYTDTYKYSAGAKDYQWYCLAEIDPTTGYVLNNDKHYFQIPVTVLGVQNYELEYSYINNRILVPESGTIGRDMYLIVGLSIMLLALGIVVIRIKDAKIFRKSQ